MSANRKAAALEALKLLRLIVEGLDADEARAVMGDVSDYATTWWGQHPAPPPEPSTSRRPIVECDQCGHGAHVPLLPACFCRAFPRCFICPTCRKTSWSPDDARYGYCGQCHDYTGTLGVR